MRHLEPVASEGLFGGPRACVEGLRARKARVRVELEAFAPDQTREASRASRMPLNCQRALGREEVAVGRADVAARRGAGAAAQHELVAHELAVVLAERAGGRPVAGVGRVGALRPLPDVAEQLRERRRGAAGARVEAPALDEVALARRALRPRSPTRPRSAAARRPSARRRRPRRSSRGRPARPGAARGGPRACTRPASPFGPPSRAARASRAAARRPSRRRARAPGRS